MRFLFGVVILFFMGIGGMAEDVSPPEAGNSGFPAPLPSDTRFVVDEGPYLDVYLYRSDGPIVFDIIIDRYVGPVDASGYLLNPQQLIDQGLISARASLRMPVYDVDVNGGSSSYAGEVDELYLNNQLIGQLNGANNIWKDNVFSVPVQYLKFPQLGGVAVNRVEVHIDQANIGNGNRWAVEIDWADLQIQTVRPILLVHGIFSNPDTWKTWTDALSEMNVPHETIDVGWVDSIEDNSQKIAARVDAMCAQYGVDKVNIVGHSHGGLDGRHYAENSDKVETVFQIATPNAGSIIADYVQAGILVGLGIKGLSVAGLAAPAGYELTTVHMAAYNRVHGANSKVNYAVLAGDYSPGGLFAGNPVIWGEDDLIVSVDSAHALKWMDHYDEPSNGWEATHFGIHKSKRYFDKYHSLVTTRNPSQEKRKRPGVSPIQFKQNTGLRSSNMQTGTLQNGDTMTGNIALGSHSSAHFVIHLTTRGSVFYLRDPEGRLINEAVAASDPNIAYEKDIAGNESLRFFIQNPLPGNWQYTVRGDNLPTGTTGFIFHAFVPESQTTFSGDVLGPINKKYNALPWVNKAGTPVQFRVDFQSGQTPVTGAAVYADVAGPNLVRNTLQLFDDGQHGDGGANDGIYGHAYTPSEVGRYHVQFYSGSAQSTESFLSNEFFHCHNSNISFAGSPYFTPYDLDNNGLFDFLAYHVPLDIPETGAFVLSGDLVDDQGYLVQHLTSRLNMASPGLDTISLFFSGGQFFDSRKDGPYTVTNVVVSKYVGQDLVPLMDGNSLTTAPYEFTDFEHPTIFVRSTSADVTRDLNENSLYDELTMPFELNVGLTGSYTLTARLANQQNGELDFEDQTLWLQAGTNLVEFTFDGFTIGKTFTDGPFFLRNLVVAGPQKRIIDEVSVSLPYDYQAFEGSVCRRLDVNGNKVIDHSEYAAVIENWRTRDPGFDLDGDGRVTILDTLTGRRCRP